MILLAAVILNGSTRQQQKQQCQCMQTANMPRCMGRPETAVNTDTKCKCLAIMSLQYNVQGLQCDKQCSVFLLRTKEVNAASSCEDDLMTVPELFNNVDVMYLQHRDHGDQGRVRNGC